MPVVLGDPTGLTLAVGSGTLPAVRVIINGALLGSATTWEIEGSTASGFVWRPRGGSGTGSGEQVVLSDAVAPMNETLTYTLRVDGATTATSTIVRPYSGTGGDGLAWDVIASLDAGTVAGVRRFGGDSRSGERRAHLSTVHGSEFLPLRLDPTAGIGGGSMSVATVGVHTQRLKGLLKVNQILLYLHDVSRCRLPGCDVDPAQILYVVDEANDLGPRIDVAERVWSLDWLAQSDPDPDHVAPLQVFDDLDAAGLTWDQLDSLGLTFDQWDTTIWTESG